jgi:hypothetical protein
MWDDLPPQVSLCARRLLGAVQDLKEAIQEQTKAVSDATETAKTKDGVSPEVPLQAEVNLPQGVEIRKRAGDAQEDRQYQNRTLLVAWLTLIAIVVYAYISYRQLSEMRKATEAATGALKTAQQANIDAENRFLEDERPYVWFTASGTNGPEFVLNPGSNPSTGQVFWQWHYTNYGKTPAYGIQWVHEEIKVGNGRSEVKLDRPYHFGSGTPLPPGKDDIAGIPSAPISPDEWPKLVLVDHSIQIKGRVDYVDSGGVLYESGFCMARLATGAAEYCDQSNENYIKKLPKPN